MSRVKRTWLMREPPVYLDFLLTKDRGAVVLCGCPQCGKAHETSGLTESREVQCSCGAFMRQTIAVTLEELEVEDVKGKVEVGAETAGGQEGLEEGDDNGE